MNEPRVIESIANECQWLGRAHESSSARAEQLIACLEGEIAKRDEELAACRVAVENCEVFRARIVELESRYQRDVYGLNNEGDPIGGDPAGGYANDNARLRTELAAIKAQEPVGFAIIDDDTGKLLPHAAFFIDRAKAETLAASTGGCSVAPLYAAPVSEAKAQGVVQWPNADEIMQMAFEEGQPADDASGYYFELEEFDLFIERLMSEVARLNASLVQQASVPDERANFESEYLKANYPRVHSGELSAPPIFGQTGKGEYEDDDMQKCWVMWQARAMLAAAPSAPAADAGLVEALEMALEIGDGCSRGFLGKFQAKARAALAAHRAKGVV